MKSSNLPAHVFFIFFLATFGATLCLTGCSASFAPPPGVPVAEINSTALRGNLFGGRTPIVGAHIYMYAANAVAYGNASTSLVLNYTGSSYPSTIDASGNYYVTTDTNGDFYFSSGEYACTAGTQVYVYSIGGNPGAGANSAAGLLAVLGQCQAGGSFTGVTAVQISEVSTIAAAYSMAGFATDATHVASSGTALATTGIANAFLNAANLYNISAGGVALLTTPNGNGTVPQKLINSLADSLSSCVNTSGPGSSPCTTLFSDAESNGSTGTIPTDTATAAINIAHNPGNDVTAIFTLAPAIAAPFGPFLSTTPNDFTVGISFAGGGIVTPRDVAVDASGNIWVSSDGPGHMTKMSSTGTFASGTPFAVTDATYIAIDSAGSAWVTSPGGTVVYKVSSAGTVSSYQPTGASALDMTIGIAIDGSNNVYLANQNDYITKLTSAGVASSDSPLTAYSLPGFSHLALDGTGGVWWEEISSNLICKQTTAGVAVASNTTSGVSHPDRIAIDNSGNAWVASYSGNAVVEFNSAVGTSATYSGGGLSKPYGIAIDGSGNAWAVNISSNSLTEISALGTVVTPTTGYTGGTLSSPYNLAIDGSGDVWMTNNVIDTVTEMIGVASPVVTPLSAGVAGNTLGTRP